MSAMRAHQLCTGLRHFFTSTRLFHPPQGARDTPGRVCVKQRAGIIRSPCVQQHAPYKPEAVMEYLGLCPCAPGRHNLADLLFCRVCELMHLDK